MLRLGAAAPLIYFGITGLIVPKPPVELVLRLVTVIGGFLLLAGLWTPVAGSVVAIGEVWNTFSDSVSPHEGPWICMVLAVVSAGVAMLGPGAWSVDARLFGRRRFEIDSHTGQRSSPQ